MAYELSKKNGGLTNIGLEVSCYFSKGLEDTALHMGLSKIQYNQLVENAKMNGLSTSEIPSYTLLNAYYMLYCEYQSTLIKKYFVLGKAGIYREFLRDGNELFSYFGGMRNVNYKLYAFLRAEEIDHLMQYLESIRWNEVNPKNFDVIVGDIIFKVANDNYFSFLKMYDFLDRSDLVVLNSKFYN